MATISVTQVQFERIFALVASPLQYVASAGNVTSIIIANEPHHVYTIVGTYREADMMALARMSEYRPMLVTAIV